MIYVKQNQSSNKSLPTKTFKMGILYVKVHHGLMLVLTCSLKVLLNFFLLSASYLVVACKNVLIA